VLGQVVLVVVVVDQFVWAVWWLQLQVV